MSSTMYYGEIVARISGKLFLLKQSHLDNIPSQRDVTMEDMICDISADAGRVFDTFEDLSGEHFINWTSMLEYYSDALCSFIRDGRMPAMADMIQLAAKSMEMARAERVQQAKALL